MEAELGRAQAALTGRYDPAPYFLAYQVHEAESAQLSAEQGSVIGREQDRRRLLTVDVRVGSRKLDNTHPLRGSGGRDPGREVLPIEDDAEAIRRVLWKQTDRAYKDATEALVQVRAQRQVDTSDEELADDFSSEAPQVFVEAPRRITLDRDHWEPRLRALAAVFADVPEVEGSLVELSVRAENRYLVSSEGTRVQTGGTHARLTMLAQTHAEDGMVLERFEPFDAQSAERLPQQAVMLAAAARLRDDLLALRRAPLAEPFTGPAILDSRAAGVFFHEILGHRLEGQRQKDDESGQTFAAEVGKTILPAGLSIFDDPRIRALDGLDLAGFYRFDDEGLPASRVQLVEDGVLRAFLMSRSPLRGFAHSNGHGRRSPGFGVAARQGNLMVVPRVVVPRAELRRRLLDEVRRQGKPYGLLFGDIQGGYTNTARSGPQVFKVLPVLVYRVYPDGRPDQLVRGVDLVGTPLTVLSRVTAAGDDRVPFNGICGAESGWLPVAAVAPSLLVSQVEVDRRPRDRDRPPLLPPPPAVTATATATPPPTATATATPPPLPPPPRPQPPVVTSTGAAAAELAGDVVLAAMRDEAERTLRSLGLAGEARPYHVAYEVDDEDETVIGAVGGALTAHSRSTSRPFHVQLRVGTPAFDNGNFVGRHALGQLTSGVTSIEPSYGPVRRDLWLATDVAYKAALRNLAAKRADRGSDMGSQSPPPSRSSDRVVRAVRAGEPPRIDSESLAARVRRASALFRGLPDIHQSGVRLRLMRRVRRLVSSDGAVVREPRLELWLQVVARTQAEDGMPLGRQLSFFARRPEELPADAALEGAIREMIEELRAARSAPRAKDYTGPVLLVGRAAPQFLADVLIPALVGTPAPGGLGELPLEMRPESEWAGRLGQAVMPRGFMVEDDPSRAGLEEPAAASAAGRRLLFGGYEVDDEGVAGRRVALVEDGWLRGLLMSRTPRRELSGSNGHGRGDVEPRAYAANLLLRSTAGQPEARLRAQLHKMAAAAGLPCGVIVRELSSGLGSAGFALPGGGEVVASPAVFSCLYPDGREVPLRGAQWSRVGVRWLRDLAGAGRASAVWSFQGGPSPGSALSLAGSWSDFVTSVATPALLLREAELRASRGPSPRPPLYPPP